MNWEFVWKSFLLVFLVLFGLFHLMSFFYWLTDSPPDDESREEEAAPEKEA